MWICLGFDDWCIDEDADGKVDTWIWFNSVGMNDLCLIVLEWWVSCEDFYLVMECYFEVNLIHLNVFYTDLIMMMST